MSNEEEDFAALFEASVKSRQFARGEAVEGTIVSIGPKVAFVDIGGKGEAEIDIQEIRDSEGDLEMSVGDRIQARVVSTSGVVVLSRRGVRNAATLRELEDAFLSGMAVEGKVAQVVKGGYEVRIARERAFCPLSQIDTVRTTDPAVHEGQTYAFRVIEYKDGGKTVVVSRRTLLEDEQRASAEEVRKAIVPGAVLPGRVVSVMDYGAFVDLGGGIQGLLHVSEMSWSRVVSPGAVVASGDEITVKVLRVDEATEKVSLGLKQLAGDPWTHAASAYEVGQVRTGRVTRVADFGAFVELEPGIEGLAHASTFPPTGRADGWKAAIAPGTTGAFEILSVDAVKKRIGLAMAAEGSSRAAGAAAARDPITPGAIVLGKVERHEPFGVFVYLAPGRTGLMPLGETGVDRGTDVARALPAGTEVEVAILEVDASGRRIRISRKAVAEQREQAEVRAYTARADADRSATLGSLADKLRGALKGR